jgi:hypothetical protein
MGMRNVVGADVECGKMRKLLIMIINETFMIME